MKKVILMVALAVLLLGTFLLAQKSDVAFEKRWEKVETLAGKQLPGSALKEVDAILAQAQKQKNSVQVIKAMVYKMRFTLEKNPDEAPALIRDFEAFTEKSTDPAERALLHSMTAELYVNYYQQNHWNANSRTDVTGFVPEDMKEWTKNIFFDKITQHLSASLGKPEVLQKTDALKFSALLLTGNDSRTLQPTLFDFLCYRRIQLLQELWQITALKNPLTDPAYFAEADVFSAFKQDTAFAKSVESNVLDTYQQLLFFRTKSNNVPALLYADLQRLQYVRQHTEIQNSDSLYLIVLKGLEKQFDGNEAVVEVLAEKANYYLGKQDNDKAYKRIAYEICADGIKRFPNYKRIELLKNIQRTIGQKTISISYSQVVKPSSVVKIKLNTMNVPELVLKVYRVNASALEYLSFQQKIEYRKQFYPLRSLVDTRQIKIKPDENFGNVETSYDFKSGDYGIYEFSLEVAGNQKATESVKGSFVVTDFSYINRPASKESANLYVLDRVSGQVQPNVKVKTYERKWLGSGYTNSLTGELKTDQNGLCVCPRSTGNNQIIVFEKNNDRFFTSNSYMYYYETSNVESKDVIVNLFTDRSLYRPGQTVYFKGIGYLANKNKQEVALGNTYTVELYDANNQKVSSKLLSANQFGSFAGEFVLPQAGLNGAYRLQVGEYSQTIWVEEYKRPTFELLINRPKTEVSFGDNVTVTGNVKAYAGYGIADAKVKYRVVRRPHRYCWWFNEPEVEMKNGTVNSNADGSFEVSFIPQKTKNEVSWLRGQFYTYSIYANVTDPKGETQNGEQTVSVGDRSLFILADMPEKINKKAKSNFEISTVTINDEIINSIVKYQVSKLQDTDIYAEKLDKSVDLKEAEQVLAGSFDTKEKKMSPDFSSLGSGRYKMTLTTTDSHGKEVKEEKVFVLYDTNDNRPPVKSYVWMLTPKTECETGEDAKIIWGTSTRNSMVLYEIMQGNTVLESRWVAFSDESKTFEIPFKESYGAGVTVMFTFMKDEQLFTNSVQLKRKVFAKKLTPILSVFRNKLLPGEKAEWTITIPETAKDKRAAELLVGMYDASLDALRPHSWDFDPTYREFVPNSPMWITNRNNEGNDYASINEENKVVYEYQMDQLYWFGLSLADGNYLGGIGPMKFKRNSLFGSSKGIISVADVKGNDNVNGMDIADVKSEVTQVSEEVLFSVTGNAKRKTKETADKPVQVRTNFNETAFFYPQLRTDKQGNVKFSFTTPESLTRWNVKMLAHTQDLYFGQGEAQVVTQKDLMVQMNLPRFVRRSDKLVLSANVVNLTDKPLTASVQFEMIDPATEKPLKLKDSAPRKVELAANGTKAVEWELTEFSPYELVTCKVVARAGNFSDGEQKYLPVLPDKVLVTESMPLTIRSNQTRTFTFESLLKNGSKVDSKNLSVEFSSNPAWYAVQALPTISAPENENALDYFTAYYANSLAAFIANSNPKIASVFDRWKKAGGSRDALLSNLQKNTELKNMLLEETPWVMAAKDETEQKRQIALLFDLNMQKNQAKQYLDKLIALQLPSGGFAWFKGMTESRYVTQEILLNMARLAKMTGSDLLTAYRLPLANALNYLDLEIARDFDNLKKYNKNYDKEMSIGNMELFYLHMRSEYPQVPVHVSAQAAVKFYTGQSEKYWTNLTLYGKAMMAVVAQRNGKIQTANDILKSLKENALKTDEFGMYWAKNTAGYFWNERPVAVQAAIIEAFAEIEKNTADIDEMKIWLLKQKQTQRWDSPMATVNAIYALLNRGTDWLASEGTVKINVGNTVLNPANTEAGTGYFKETIPVADIRPEMGKVTVSTIEGTAPGHPVNKSSIGWGAMYWQYYQNLDKIEGQGGPLKVSKKLFVEKLTATGKTMLPIEQTKLAKGDKVITRLVVTTDRNLEFVALKDLRASCFEPVNQLSSCKWKEGVCYYETTKECFHAVLFLISTQGNIRF
ncbi:MAG: alpha-2-macroglobulin family protein [Paludibacter sp.]